MKHTVKTLINLENKLGESPIWHVARNKLHWVDLYAPALFECNLDGSGFRTRPLAADAPIGSIAATTDPDQVIIALKSGLHLLHLDTMALTFYCDPERGRSGIIPNDIKVDRWGRLWFGTSHEKETDPRGALWCISDRNTCALADVGFAVSNGPAFSIDGSVMYFNDSVKRQTLAYDIAPDHTRAENRRLLASYTETEGMPDGVTVDRAGDIWVAMWGGASMIRLSPHGKKRETISVPAHQVTSMAFFGNLVFITSARDGLNADMLKTLPQSGSLFSLNPTANGLDEPLFKLT